MCVSGAPCAARGHNRNPLRDRLGEQIEPFAHHALRGELREKAVDYLRQAGAKAAAGSALQDARIWFEQALGVLEALPRARPRWSKASRSASRFGRTVPAQ